MRPFFFLLGWCSFGLGAVGAVVPGLPTVPLMLVALWAFSKSSQRFHDWLYHHAFFGPPLREWHVHRVIPMRAKVLSVVMMTASLAYMAFFADLPLWVLGMTALFMAGGAAFILMQRSEVPVESAPDGAGGDAVTGAAAGDASGPGASTVEASGAGQDSRV